MNYCNNPESRFGDLAVLTVGPHGWSNLPNNRQSGCCKTETGLTLAAWDLSYLYSGPPSESKPRWESLLGIDVVLGPVILQEECFRDRGIPG